jgi:hypothetical protein
MTADCPLTKTICFACGGTHAGGRSACPADKVKLVGCCFRCGLPKVVEGVVLHTEDSFGGTRATCPYLGLTTAVMMAWQRGLIKDLNYRGPDAAIAKGELFTRKDLPDICHGVREFLRLVKQ